MALASTQIAALDREDRALIACCAAAARPGLSPPDFGGIDTDDLDWSGFVARARWHGLHGTIYPVVATHMRPSIESSAWNWLRRLAGAQARHNLRLAEALVEIHERFSALGVSYAVLKGLPLAQELYGTITARRCRDIDLLVAPGEFAAARAALEDLGYASAHGFSPAQDDVWLRYASDLPMSNPTRHVLVELHQRFEIWPERAARRGAQQLLRRAAPARIGEIEVPAVLGDGLIPYLAWHGHKHAWFRLFWLLDIAALEWRSGGKDREAVWHAAGEIRQQRALALAWWLSSALFGVPEPAAATGPHEADRVEALGRLVLDRALGPVRPTERHSVRRRAVAMQWDWQAATGAAQRTALLRGYLFSVQPDDIRAVPLPPSLYRLYPLLRPLRILGRLAAAPLRWLVQRFTTLQRLAGIG